MAAQLLAQGTQDVWLTGDPEMSFYRSTYRRHAPYAASVERFEVPMSGRIRIQPKSDLIGYTYLTAHDLSTGALVPNLDWSTVISSVDLVIGNQTIATHDLTYINTIQRVCESDTWSKTSTSGTFQPLGFFFDRQYLPIIALRYSDVQMNITWLSGFSSYTYRCWVSCIYLDESERRFFTEKPFQMLIPRLQRVPIQNDPSFYGPLKYIAAPCLNYANVYYSPPSPPPPLPSGVVQWATRIAGPDSSFSAGVGILVKGSGNIYVSGLYSSNPLTSYNSDGTAFATTLPNSGSYDCFIAKYTTDGSVVWATRIAGAGYDSPGERRGGISADGSGNLYITGVYDSNPLTLYNSDGTAFSNTLPVSAQDCFIAKYTSSGSVAWATRIAGINVDGGSSSSVDESGNLYFLGNYYFNSLTLYNSDGTAFGTTLPNSGVGDCFIAKYTTDGSVVWATRIAGSGIDTGAEISIDGSGNLYVTGYYESNPLTLYNSDGTAFGTTLPNSGSNDCFVAKYTSSGSVAWATRIAGSLSDYGNSISVDGSGNLYVTGIYQSNPLTLYNSDGTAFGTTLPNSGSNDCFVAKYTTDGSVVWATRIAGSGMDIGNSISVDGAGNLYVTGPYQSNPLTLYNSDTTTFSNTLPNSGSYDCFIAKYTTDGSVAWATRIAGSGNDIGNSISVDGAGNVYVTGYYGSNPLTLYNSDTTTFSNTLPCSGVYDCFIVKYSA